MSDTLPNGTPVHLSRPERIKAAVLEIVGGMDLREQTVRIDYVGAPVGYALHAASGVCVATCDLHPVPLSEYAFNNGALRVVHNYDLRNAE